jgi:predicted molibdopterin-dependent oxidoreductase YjgC
VFADAVLPVATVHERAGTTTNIEGRITRLGQKLLAPGQCRPDWMIAAELATRMGRDLGVTSVAELWDEIEGLAPSHAGITRAVLDLPAARDGIVAPLAVSRVSLEPGTRLEMFDPMATPGITAVEAQGAPLRAGVVGDGRAVDGPEGSAAPARPAGGSRPTMMGLPRSLPEVRVPPADSYSLRLIAQRSLYDGGVTIGACASLAALVPAAVLHVNSHDLERIGVATGDRVRVRSSRTSAVLEVAADEGVTRGTAALGFNLRSADAAGVAALIEVSRPVVDVRLETL